SELEDYLDYYNNRRIKLKLNGLTPAQHRHQAISAA
ncbi:MAG: IS3 family transposase, partial [Clostridia bacterium]|nr:IS3 family transposase [Clostridia bacterium]